MDLFIIDATDYHTSRIIQRFICDSFQNGSIGHRIYRRFLDLGFVDVQSTPLVQNFADFPLIESAFEPDRFRRARRETGSAPGQPSYAVARFIAFRQSLRSLYLDHWRLHHIRT